MWCAKIEVENYVLIIKEQRAFFCRPDGYKAVIIVWLKAVNYQF